ncbi:AraC family transcriptional regulator [Treponema sp.]
MALFLHFYSQSHYIKVFKKFTGMTPKQFKDIYCKK